MRWTRRTVSWNPSWPGSRRTRPRPIREAWDAVERALRSLVLEDDAASATGHALIREARQRHLITFDQANGLAAFHALRERLDFPEYVVSDADIAIARSAVERLQAEPQSRRGRRCLVAPRVAIPLAETIATHDPAPIAPPPAPGPTQTVGAWSCLGSPHRDPGPRADCGGGRLAGGTRPSWGFVARSRHRCVHARPC